MSRTDHSRQCLDFQLERMLRRFNHRGLRRGHEINGPWAEFEAAFARFRRYVIPALLDPLQSHGRILKPCLVHGDLWEENAGVNIDTQQPVVFDPSCMYAHNEYDLGMWRREVIRFGQPYFRQYLMRMPPSEPASQWGDRNRLYSIKST